MICHRQGLACVVSAAAWLMLASAASACDERDGGDGPPLTTRRPVFGAGVHLAAGFGVRRHPLLDTLKFHQGVDWVGSTGLTAEPHLHFEVRRNGTAVDPLQWPLRNPDARRPH